MVAAFILTHEIKVTLSVSTSKSLHIKSGDSCSNRGFIITSVSLCSVKSVVYMVLFNLYQ